jgi:hypothetical protein
VQIALIVINSTGAVERVLLGDENTLTKEAVSGLLDSLTVPPGLPTTERKLSVWRVPVTSVDSVEQALTFLQQAKVNDA